VTIGVWLAGCYRRLSQLVFVGLQVSFCYRPSIVTCHFPRFHPGTELTKTHEMGTISALQVQFRSLVEIVMQ
jgi:hypothetical protein